MLAEGKNIKKNRIFSTKILAEIIIFVSVASVLSNIKIYALPQGGSVTLASMVPILWFTLRRGPKLGLIAGIIYGLVQLAFGPIIVHPLQMLLDYPIAFGLLGIAGFFKKHPIIGVSLGILARFLVHFISGIVYFSVYAPEGMHPAIYSAIYNGSYLIIELIISIYIIYLLSKSRILQIFL